MGVSNPGVSNPMNTSQEGHLYHRLSRLAVPFNASRPLHPIALSMVGSVRTMWLPFIAPVLGTFYPSDADLFMTISLGDPTGAKFDAYSYRESVARALLQLRPVHVHIIRNVFVCP